MAPLTLPLRSRGLDNSLALCSLVQAPFAHLSQRKRAFDIMAKRTTTTHGDTRSPVEISQMPKLELILPMILQIGKVFFLRGSRITTAMAILYLIVGLWCSTATVGSISYLLTTKNRGIDTQDKKKMLEIRSVHGIWMPRRCPRNLDMLAKL
jgi:hypothetical protein